MVAVSSAEEIHADVVVVGGGIAGCAAAIRLARGDRRVVVLERRSLGDDAYKRLCTHFIQPSAVSILRGLGLGALADPRYAVPTRARLLTPGGVIDAPVGYLPEDPGSVALNLERRVLDPALRAAARAREVEILDGTSLGGLEAGRDGWRVEARTADGIRRIRASLVVAADGRGSAIARALENPMLTRRNDRAARFAYFSGIPRPAGDRSLFVHHGDEMAFVYPLVGGRTLLSLYVTKPRSELWKRSPDAVGEFLAYFGGLPEVPALDAAEPESDLLGYGDYPVRIRQPVWRSVPFVGDAALSVDPMSGVGCGFALTCADILGEAFDERDFSPRDVHEGLKAYKGSFERVLVPHVSGLCGNAIVGRAAAAREQMFRTISGNTELSRQYLALTGRLMSPAEFQRALMRAL